VTGPRPRASSCVRLSDPSALGLLLRRVDAAADGEPAPDTVSTGFPSVDRLLGGGVRTGDLVVLGGDVGSGKSALALAMALRSVQTGRGAAFLSGETTAERTLERALAIEGRVSIDDMRRGVVDDATRAALGVAALRLRDAAPTIAHFGPGGADALADELRRALDVSLAVVDPLQALAVGARPLDEELATAVTRMKALAIELGVAVVLTAHLPGLGARRADPRPTLDDFGALSAVKQHADVVLGLFREEMYQLDRANEGATELHVLKNRNGATGYVDLYFYKQWLRFEDMVEPDR
jgi:replicative DNA helicase